MRKIFLTCLVIYFSSNLFATEITIELAREKGYQSKIKGDFSVAINGYQKVLELNPDDYDAMLALGRLGILQKDLPAARKYFELILAIDETDLEAYLGLAKCAELAEDYPLQIIYLKKIIRNAPENISEEFLVNRLFELAATYQYNQQYRAASKTYDEILKIDATYAEAWAEKAKLAFWSNRPFQAQSFYQVASKWDPAHLPYQENLKKMAQLTKLMLSTRQNYLQETEAGLQTQSYEQIYKVSKRLNDIWESELAYHSIYSYRDRSGYKTAILDDFIKLKNRFYWQADHFAAANMGYSILENKLLNYQLHLSNYFYFASLKIYHHLSYNHELFEFWNEVSRKYINDNIRISA
ncbi:MAG: tetratricopeptide repeat protein, partial [Candidatus Cloacimonadales bacterium]